MEQKSEGGLLWRNLVEFVQAAGGYVHPSLQLVGDGPSRGVVASSPLSKGGLLIRLPPSCVIHGERLGPNAPETAELVSASPWLRCLGAYLLARTYHCFDDELDETVAEKISWTPYFQSLPTFHEYETLFQWTLDEIQTYLRGTTLGQMLLLDRTERSTEEQYRLRVEPFLERLGLLDQAAKLNPTILTSNPPLAESPNYQSFLDASMCISTRGFHLMKQDDRSKRDEYLLEKNTHDDQQESSTTTYNGPFLLPVIDMLNHDPSNACTTLQRDPSTGSFVMVAGRSLTAGEPVVHSYGDDLTSAQLLQTFGFVPQSHTYDVILSHRRGLQSGDTQVTDFAINQKDRAQQPLHGLTPAYLHRTNHLLVACQNVKRSSYPQYVRETMIQEKQTTLEDAEEEEDEDDYFWDVRDIPTRPMSETIPEEIVVSISNDRSKSNHFLLSEELVTLLAVQFLPEDAYLDIFPDHDASRGGSTTLDRSILAEDNYLRKLVCRSLLIAIDRKVDEYTIRASDSSLHQQNDSHKTTQPPFDTGKVSSESESDRLVHLWNGDQRRLEQLMTIPQPRTVHEQREVYGLTIRMEELANLKMLGEEVQELTTISDGTRNSSCCPSGHQEPPNKRSKK